MERKKEFYIPYGKMVCRNMKMTTLKDLYESLLNMENKIEIDEDLRLKAYDSLKICINLGVKNMKRVTDVLIVGSGVAGLYTALNLREDLEIIMVSKSQLIYAILP